MKSKLYFTSLLLAVSLCYLSSFNTYAAEDTNTQILLTNEVAADNTGKSVDTFNKDTANIFVVVKSTEFKAGQKLKAVWIAEDTAGAAPNNFKVGESEVVLKSTDAAPGGNWTSKFALSKPTKGWPAGKYHVELFSDGKPYKTVSFSIK